LSLTRLLFGELASSSVAAHNAFLQRANSEHERDRVRSSALAFSAYLLARLIDALLELDTTADSQVGFQWQREATAKQLHDLPLDDPETNHLLGILEAIVHDSTQRSTLALNLTAYAYFLEHDGRLEEALTSLALSARVHGADLSPTDAASYGLFAARLNRLLTRWDQAVICYQAAEASARQQGDFVLALRGRLGQGTVARGQGNFPRARAIAEAVIREAVERNLPQVQCIAYADLSAVFSVQQLPLEALRASYAAFLIAITPLDRLHTLSNLGTCLADIGAYDQARLALEIATKVTVDFRLRANAMIDLMHLESLVGNRPAFERHRATITENYEQIPPSLAVDYHCKLGSGLARFGQNDRAIEALQRAMELSEAHALNARYFQVKQALQHLEAQRTAAKTEAPATLRQAPLVREVEVGLREYASAALE